MELSIRESLADDEHGFIYDRLIVPSMNDLKSSRVLNRSVTGSMNDLQLMARHYLADGDMSLVYASVRLNEAPMSYLDGISPGEAFARMRLNE